MPPINHAAWLTTYDSPLEVKEAPYPSPSTKQIIIHVHAIAINPVDWGTQLQGGKLFPWLKLPYILGSDISGSVIEIGSSVTKFRVGDRIVGQGLNFQHNNPAEGAFQEYVLLSESMACKIPDEVKYEDAAVLPLGLATAATGLFQDTYLGLEFPGKEGKGTVVIWGGSTSVGCCAIQLAVAAGYEVFTTASPKNFELVKGLGAKKVFNHNDSEKAVDGIVKALEGKSIVGAFAIGSPMTDRNGFGAGEACLEIVKKCQGRKFVAMVSSNLISDWYSSFSGFYSTNSLQAMYGPAELAKDGVEAKFVTSEQLKTSEVGKMLYGEFLPGALKEGKFVCAPEALVVGDGLKKIQEALDLQKKGVSARKVVVTL